MSAGDGSAASTQVPPALAGLLQRRSVSPRRLGPPGPTPQHIADIVSAGLCAPDHGSLAPWRVLEFAAGQRADLADLFAQEKLRRDPRASSDDLERAREHATRAPVLLAFVVCLQTGAVASEQEQWLAAGAALGNLLNAIDAQGVGGIMLSGARCSDAELVRSLGVLPHERLAGFISVGTRVKEVPPRQRAQVQSHWSAWPGLHE